MRGLTLVAPLSFRRTVCRLLTILKSCLRLNRSYASLVNAKSAAYHGKVPAPSRFRPASCPGTEDLLMSSGGTPAAGAAAPPLCITAPPSAGHCRHSSPSCDIQGRPGRPPVAPGRHPCIRAAFAPDRRRICLPRNPSQASGLRQAGHAGPAQIRRSIPRCRESSQHERRGTPSPSVVPLTDVLSVHTSTPHHNTFTAFEADISGPERDNHAMTVPTASNRCKRYRQTGPT